MEDIWVEMTILVYRQLHRLCVRYGSIAVGSSGSGHVLKYLGEIDRYIPVGSCIHLLSLRVNMNRSMLHPRE